VLAAEPFLCLVTFRQDGTAVPTPIWTAPGEGCLLVWTGVDSGKVKRLRHTSAVTVAPCDRVGSLLGEPVPAHARILPRDDLGVVDAAMRAKYGWQFRIAKLGAAIGRVIGISRPGQTGLAVTLD
jgi:PPOX class probable F420-dependent enzyme